MNIKKERKDRTSGVKILNDEKIPPLPSQVMTVIGNNKAMPTTSPKPLTISIAKPKSTSAKQMDHYVLQTIKGETDGQGIIGETIDFVLKDEGDVQSTDGIGPISGEITEEVHLSDDGEGEENTQEIVEHVCGKCYKSFRRFNGLKKHLDFCRFDSGYHLRKAQMLKNIEKIEKDAIVMENKDICFCCGESYDTFHLGHINCPDCPKSFKSQISYERHIFITHSEFDDFPCTICNAKLRSSNLLILHVEQHKNRGKPYACKICGKDFTRPYHLKRHQKYSSCSASENDSMSCKVCDRTFFRLDNLRAHLKQHLGTHVTKKPEYMCPMCKNCFYSLSTLNIHTRTHTGERPFDCDLCEKKFPSLVALKKHRRYHTGEKPYTCTVCNQSFAVKEVLNRHMKRHTGERPHVCKECGKSFIQASQLRSHLKTHVKPFECDECKEKFKTSKQLERHAKRHKKGRRNKVIFKCSICKANFKTEDQLKEHMAEGVHTERPKRQKRKERTDCAICEKNFDTAKNLHFHILKVHEVNPEDFINEKESTPPRKIYKLEKTSAGDDQIEIITTADGEIIPFTKETSAGNDENNEGVVIQEFIIDELPSTSPKKTITLENESFTLIPLDSDGNVIKSVTTNKLPVQLSSETRTGLKKSLAESLAAAIADNEEEKTFEIESAEDAKLKDNVSKLLDMLVETNVLKKFGWPKTPVETILCKVIENCGYNLSKDSQNYKDYDYSTRMREYVKLLFTVVVQNDSIKALLNNYPIDEVIEYVLGNDDDDKNDGEDEDGDEDNERNDDEDDDDDDD